MSFRPATAAACERVVILGVVGSMFHVDPDITLPAVLKMYGDVLSCSILTTLHELNLVEDSSPIRHKSLRPMLQSVVQLSKVTRPLRATAPEPPTKVAMGYLLRFGTWTLPTYLLSVDRTHHLGSRSGRLWDGGLDRTQSEHDGIRSILSGLAT